MSVFVPQFRRDVTPTPQPQKAGPIGPGASVLNTEYPLSLLGFGQSHQDPRRRIREAWQLGRKVPWIRVAERVISDRAATVPWHLEDDDDQDIDDEYPDTDAQRINDLFEQPQGNLAIGRRMTGREMKALTYRHMGLCGVAFWYADATDGLGIPNAYLYIRPDRMWPKEDAAGNLVDWMLDADAQGKGGIPLGLENVRQFNLQAPDEGHYGIGLVESALMKAQLSTDTDQYADTVIRAGGRIQGILSPKTGGYIESDNMYNQMVLDARTITEQPDAAKRLQIIRGPIDFTSTAMTMEQAKAVEMMTRSRDDLIALWGVPLSAIGISEGRGLNSGDARKYDDEALWQNAVEPRVTSWQEVMQFQWLDRIPAIHLELEIDGPTFEDSAGQYDNLQKSVSAPLRNAERRAIIGLEPFGADVMGFSGVPLDDEVWLPATTVQAFVAPEEGAQVVAVPQPVEQTPQEPNTPAAARAGDTPQTVTTPGAMKAEKAGVRTSMQRLRASIEQTMTPRMRHSVGIALRQQLDDVIARIRAHPAHVKAKPRDYSVWWDAPKNDMRMKMALAGHFDGIARAVNSQVVALLPPQKANNATARVLDKGAGRVTNINATTRDAIVAILADATENDLTLGDTIDAIEASTAFDETRAELVARTELMFAYNDSAIESYRDGGVEQVQAIDGDGDEECAERDGQIYDLDEADSIEDHPNGTLDWVPLVGSDTGEEGKAFIGKATEPTAKSFRLVYDELNRVVEVIER